MVSLDKLLVCPTQTSSLRYKTTQNLKEPKFFMTKIDLVFRTIGERTSKLALEFALKNIAPDKLHLIENVRPFSRAVEEMLTINYEGDFVIFMDADCLILEDMRPFLNRNTSPYVDCYVLDKFRGRIHMGVHITRADLVRAMQQIKTPQNDMKYVLKPESRIRNFALHQLHQDTEKMFKRFKILHDFCQYYHHVFMKYALRELRSRTDCHRLKLEVNINNWPLDDLDFVVAKQAIDYTRRTVPPASSPAYTADFIADLPNIARRELEHMQEKPPLELAEVLALAAEPRISHQFQSNQTKVFGIGLSRTCTKSLTMALNILGINAIHYPDDETTFEELSTGKYNFSVLNDYDGITDITVAPFYAHLDKLYPNSKFILTMRNKDAWLESLETHWENRPAFADRHERETHMKIRRFLRAAVYGSYTFQRERMAYVYDLHYQNVLNYFKDRPKSLLIMDIPAGESWAKLCPFLNQPVLHEPFPNVKNKSVLRELL